MSEDNFWKFEIFGYQETKKLGTEILLKTGNKKFFGVRPPPSPLKKGQSKPIFQLFLSVILQNREDILKGVKYIAKF